VSWWQLDGGEREPVRCEYRLLDDHAFGFTVPGGNVSLPLVIDPVLDFTWSTVIGGSLVDLAYWFHAIDVDAQDRITVAGTTYSTDFPVTPGVAQSTHGGVYDMWIAEIPAGSAGGSPSWITYIGGLDEDRSNSVDRFSDGRIVVGGASNSSNYPLAAGGVGPSGDFDIALSVLASDGSLLEYSTLLGGASYDGVQQLRVIGLDRIDFCGSTSSAGLPTTVDAWQGALAGGSDGFFATLDLTAPVPSDLSFLSYCGDDAEDHVFTLDRVGDTLYLGGQSSNALT